MKIKTLEDLLTDELKDLYSAENQITKALPKMAKTTQSRELRAAFESTSGRPRIRSSAWRRPATSWASVPRARNVSAWKA